MHRIRLDFDWITRFAALAVLLACIAIFVLVVWNLSWSGPQRKPVEQIAGAQLDKALHLSSFQQVPGDAMLYTTLSWAVNYALSSGRAQEECNLLFFDTASKKGHWLFNGNDQVIRSMGFLTDPPSNRDRDFGPAATGKAVALLLEVEQPAKDGRPAQRHLAIAGADGRQVTTPG